MALNIFLGGPPNAAVAIGANPSFTGVITGPVGSAGAPTYTFTGHTTSGFYWDTPDSGIGVSVAGTEQLVFRNGATQQLNGDIGVSSDAGHLLFGILSDVSLARDAADQLGLRRSTHPQQLGIYGTYTDASNLEALLLYTVASADNYITSVSAGTGTTRSILIGAGNANSNTWRFGAPGGGNGSGFSPFSDATQAIGDANHRVSNIFSAIGTFGTATNALTTGIYLGNDSSNSITIDAAGTGVNGDISFRAASGTQAARTIVADGRGVGGIYGFGWNGTGYDNLATIIFRVDGTPGAAADMPGRIDFYTAPDGSATPLLRYKITNGGNHIWNNTGALLAQGATNGFQYITGCATGKPNGTPALSVTGTYPMIYDSVNKKICIWDGAAWNSTAALS